MPSPFSYAATTLIVLEIALPMPRHIAKANLPHKDCAHCGRPFAWRKKWEKVWHEVRFCSEACKRTRRTSAQPTPFGTKPSG